VAQLAAREAGAQVRAVTLPYPAFDAAQLLANIEAALGPRTRLVIVDHVTADSALILPVAEIAARCRARGALVLVDGAQPPGMLALDVPALGVDFYVGNLHKWACTPRSCAFLWATPAQQATLHPPVVSWGLDKGFTVEFDFIGTRDSTAWLSAPEGIAFLRDLPEGAARAYRHRLVWEAAQMLQERLRLPFLPAEATTGAMVAIPLPERLGTTAEDAARLRDALLFEDHVEVVVHGNHGRLFLRICAQVYNDRDDFERLAAALQRRSQGRG
jgi:isopenicillin-N epimerase